MYRQYLRIRILTRTHNIYKKLATVTTVSNTCSGAGTGADHSRFLHIIFSLFVMKMLRCLQHCYECEEDEESVSPLTVKHLHVSVNVSKRILDQKDINV